MITESPTHLQIILNLHAHYVNVNFVCKLHLQVYLQIKYTLFTYYERKKCFQGKRTM